MQYISTVHNLHIRSHTRVVPRCASLWVQIDRTHSGSTWLDPLPQCQISHSDVLSSVNITTAKKITINIACVSCIQSSYSTLIDTPAQHPTDSQHPHWREMRQQGYQVLKSAPTRISIKVVLFSHGPRPTTTNRRCRNPFSQWQRSFQRKLRHHWPKFSQQHHVATIRQCPGFMMDLPSFVKRICSTETFISSIRATIPTS